ncbi:hypothetical protein ELE36_03720 [Pseudolysobacter antarcticus]|uniref:HEPN domain-containing protein n=1 Tax=Pseudolysobacter antarcticus TaxID=2511995 RepID=A0A411HGE3_9GAMM|nr:hypothetical protein [Pseudolysobacter antarcticus]QBB69559.1 hypothetical protein ELE36_03720 [Pseudolysobacter antarcticus]
MESSLQLDPNGFAVDPFGYSALAWHKWGLLATANGFPIDITKPPTVEDLKNPVLWLSHANALSEAAICLVKNPPNFESIPSNLRTICHSQYHAVALMLVGYSLEICLKAMILIKLGVDEFTKQEKNHFHHRLDELANFIPELSKKDQAILRGLSHFVVWAGRYPDPGSKRVSNAVDVFEISEQYKVSAKDLFQLSARVMRHVQTVVR